MYYIKFYIYALWRCPFHLFSYYLSKDKDTIMKDIERWVQCLHLKKRSYAFSLLELLIYYPEYRNIFYYRLKPVVSKLLSKILYPASFLKINVNNIGPGIFVQHGFSTIIYADSIGENFWVNQNVTIGDSGRGIPIIGDNVKVGTGAVVLGPIKIGNNVLIGANATVVKNVDDSCVVVSSGAYVVKRNNIRVCEEL